MNLMAPTNLMSNKFKILLECPYCKSKGKLITHKSDVQRIILYTAICSKECNPKAKTFAVKDKECAIELWTAANINIKKKTQGD